MMFYDQGKERESTPMASEAAVRSSPGPEPARVATGSHDVEDAYPATPLQQGLLFHAELEPESRAYCLQQSYRAVGPLNAEALRRACGRVMERHGILRTSFRIDGREAGGVSSSGGASRGPSQSVHRDVPVPMSVRDWRGYSTAEQEARRQALLREDLERGFDLSQPPLFRFQLIRTADDVHEFVKTFHHLITDGWSSAIFMKELATFYAAEVTGQTLALPPAPPFRAYVDWLSSRPSGEAESFFRRQLAGVRGPTELQIASPSGASSPPQHDVCQVSLSQESTARLLQLGRTRRLTLNSLVQGAWALVLGRYSGDRAVVFGVTVSGRAPELPEAEHILGPFINTLPLRVDVEPGLELFEWLRQLQLTNLELREHESVPLTTVKAWTECPATQPLFETIVVFENYARPGGALPAGGGKSLSLERQTLADPTHYPLTLYVQPGERLTLRFSFDARLFRRAAIQQIATHALALLEHFARLVDCSSSLQSVGRILELGFWQARSTYLRDIGSTIQRVGACAPEHLPFDGDLLPELQRVSEQRENEPAVFFGSEQVSYGELQQHSDWLAAELIARGVSAEQRVGVLLRRSADLPTVLLGIWKAGAACLPLTFDYPRSRSESILQDAGVSILLTEADAVAEVSEWSSISPAAVASGRPRPPVESVQALLKSNAHRSPPSVNLPGAALAYVIYTSGSTGEPKGVRVSRAALASFLSAMRAQLDPPDSSSESSSSGLGHRWLAVTTLAFDISLLELCLPLLCGGSVVVASDDDVRDGTRLAKVLAESKAQYLQATPSTWQLLLAGGWSGTRGLTALCGGEALSPTLAEQLLERVDELWNVYGPTETTVWSSATRVTDPRQISIGGTLPNTTLHVLDSWGFAAAPGVAGEICLGGHSLAHGYHGASGKTAERFVPDPVRGEGARLYRTGDLARVQDDGRLEYLGRRDEQVKLRGHRIELGEIERALVACPLVSAAAVVLRHAGQPQAALVAFVVPSRDYDEAKVRAFLQQRLPAVMVPTGWVTLERLPLTANGKINRRALPDLPREDRATSPKDAVSPGQSSATELLLASIWRELLGVDRVASRANFFELGGHSLVAMQLVARLRRSFEIEIPLHAVFDQPEFGDLAHAIEQARRNAAGALPPLVAQPVREAPLSFNQERLWFLHQLDEDAGAYNLTFAVRIRGSLERAVVEEALTTLVERHAALRTRFRYVKEAPRQSVVAASRETLPVLPSDGPSEPAGRIDRALETLAKHRFDLEASSPWRAAWLPLGENDQAVIFSVHHIAADGWSLELLLRELTVLIAARDSGAVGELKQPPVSYLDYAIWQRESLGHERVSEQLRFWKRQLSGAPAELALPTDRPRPKVFRFRGASVPFEISEDRAHELRRLCREHDSTLFMVLLAGLGTLMQRFSGESDLPIGTPVSGRNLTELEGVLGTFVNTLVLRVDASKNPTFVELIGRVRRVALDAYAHQDVPFERVVAEVNPARSLAHTPLFQVMLAVHHRGLGASATLRSGVEGEHSEETTDLDFDVVAPRTKTSKFDLVFHVEDAPGSLRGKLEFNSELYSPETARRLVDALQRVLACGVDAPETRLSELHCWSPAEQLGALQNGCARRHHAASDTLVERFEAVARAQPDAIAVTSGEASLSYRELHQQAAAVASWLRQRGVGPEVPVGLCVQRSVELVVGILGVLKAGGFYVPLEPDLPFARRQLMIDDAGLRVAVAQRDTWEKTPRCDQVLFLDDGANELGGSPEPTTAVGTCSDHLAYMLYTSGSTGEPKGVGITHRQVLRLLAAAREHFSFREDDVWSLTHSYAFDFSVWELWGALLHGGRVIVVPRHTVRDPERLAALLVEQRVTMLSQTPSAFYALAPHLCASSAHSLRSIVFGGEALDPHRLVNWFEAVGENGPELANMYGITETTVHVTHHRVTADAVVQDRGGHAASVIGRPLDDLGIYLLDANLQPVPPGLVGEIYVSGDGVGRGYPGRPGVTAERFVPNPFHGSGTRLYRSGDRARLRPDGDLEYLGRTDNQVQLRGHRIELGEVRAALRNCAEVAEAEVLVRCDSKPQSENALLVAYVVLVDTALSDASARVLAEVSKRLPEYMVPNRIAVLEKMPLTKNGKVDHSALHQSPAFPSSGSSERYAAPKSRLEQLLADIWADALGLDRVSVHDDFFELGGHSLLAVRVMEAVRSEVGGTWPLTALFEAPTIARLADVLSKSPTDKARLVALNSVSAGPRVYCFHPAGGHLMGYRKLATDLGEAGYRVLGFASQAVIDPAWQDDSIVALAQRYAHGVLSQEQKSQSGTEDVALLGWSLGGIVALAVAAELERAGRRVRFVGLIDAPRPDERGQSSPSMDLVETYAAKIGVDRDDPVLLKLPHAERKELLVRLESASSEDARLGVLVEFAQARRLLSSNISPAVCQWLVATLKNARRLLDDHTIESVAADLRVWYAAGRSSVDDPEVVKAAWLPRTRGRVQVVAVSATHTSIVHSRACIEGVRKALGGVPSSSPNNKNQ